MYLCSAFVTIYLTYKNGGKSKMNKLDIIKFYEHCLLETEKIYNSFCNYVNNVDYAYADACHNFLAQYNDLIKKYSQYIDIPLNQFSFYPNEYSDSKKTIRDYGYKRLLLEMKSFIDFLKDKIMREKLNNAEKSVEPHQMRRCLKTGVSGCPKNPNLCKNQVFVGMPFNDKYEDVYVYGIKLVFEQYGYSIFRADLQTDTIDIMCKICYEMQRSSILLFNISESNPNVMLEVGLSYGLGKKILLIKDKDTKPVSDISGIEYLEYTHAGNLQQKLSKFLNNL